MRATRGIKGFTLLELLVVSVLIAITLAVTVPRVQGLFFNDPLSRSTRILVSAINEAREITLETNQGGLMLVDLSYGTVSIQPQTARPNRDIPSAIEPLVIQLEAPVTFASVWTHSNGRQLAGKRPIWINQRGLIEPAIIELRDADRIMSLKISPFAAAVEVFDQALPPPETMLAGGAVNR